MTRTAIQLQAKCRSSIVASSCQLGHATPPSLIETEAAPYLLEHLAIRTWKTPLSGLSQNSWCSHNVTTRPCTAYLHPRGGLISVLRNNLLSIPDCLDLTYPIH
ncbi:hypothetical protein FA13DRAFT_111203 [Coprinellus micaceus]|uniref:Uncharacterized protein n=1 Tax=Coprinellus micaceus TaxID=71717 RepID=A0A4Y7THX1_COPMI|nr:hypothetical protein FA13DRAFT_111203 [Coprinellus micaceus]